MRLNLNEVYRDSGLGKWFHGESATKEPGWDRYNSEGKRVGKCGDAKEGSSYSACLSKQKANKLGEEGRANFVKRKRAAQSKRGRGKKGTGKKGKKPIFVKTGASEKMNENTNIFEARRLINLSHSSKAAKRLARHHGITDPKAISQLSSKLKTRAHHGGMASRIERLATKTTTGPQDKASIIATLSKSVGLPYEKSDVEAGRPAKTPPSKLRVPSEESESTLKQPSLFDLSEDCGCDKETPAKKILKRTREKYMKEHTSNWTPKESLDAVLLEDFTQLDLYKFVGKKVLLETDTGTYFGQMIQMKENCAISNGEIITKVFDSADVVKIVCEGQKYVITEGENKANDTEAWSSCKSQAKKKFDVYPSAYANAWAAKCYKKKGGTWSKKSKKKLDEVFAEQEPEQKIKLNESASLLLKDRLKKLFFSEEIVNPENEFTMTNAEIQERDKRAEAMLSNPNFKPKLKNKDNKENAAHRIATDAVISERGGKGYEKGLFGGEDERKEKKYSRRKTRDLRRLTRGDKTEGKYEKKRRSGRNREKTAKNPETGERRTFANVEGTKGERFSKASKTRDEKTVSRSRYRKENKD